MTIQRSETDLNESDYGAIPDRTGSLSAQITLQRYGPVWTDHPNDTDNGRSGECFDAILVGQYLLRAYGCTVSEVSTDYMPSEVAGISDATWEGIDCTAVDSIDIDVPISLVTGTSPAARMFYVDASGTIRYSDCADITTGSFGAGTDVYKPGAVILQVAATSTTRVHYITKTGEDNRRLRYAEYDGSWSTVDSDVYWPYSIHGFDAVALDADTDLLVITTDLPPLIGSRVIGTEVTAEVSAVQALVAFEVKNGRWSEWLPIDVIDRVPGDYSKARDDARVSYHNDLLFTTYDRAGGDGEYEYTKPGVTRSGDGRSWEYPEFIPDAAVPYVILPRDDYLYAVGVSGTLRSPRCTWAGQDPVEYDATPYVLGMESQAAEIRNSNVSLANPPTSTTDVFQGTLADELPLSDNRLQLKYELGYWIDGTARRVHVSTEDVTQRGEQRSLPNLNLGLVSQDYLGRVNRTRSDYAAEWPSMQCGKDPFDDTTGTGYGGLRHMAPIKPSFKADDGTLNLISSNKEGIAVSTFVSDALCGSAQTSFQVVNDNQNEYAGIVFRTFDKDNLYYCAYYPDDNLFRLYRRTGVEISDVDYTDTLIATSSAITDSPSWAGDETGKHYVKILVEYNKLTLYRSEDGIEWQTVSWATPAGNFVELPGTAAGGTSAWSGRFGVIGYGYSDQDEPPPWRPIPWPPPTEPRQYGVVILAGGDPDGAPPRTSQLFRSSDFFTSANPMWTDTLTGSLAAAIAAGGTLYNVTAKGQIAYIASNDTDAESSNGLWYSDNFLEGSPTWALIKSTADARTEAVAEGSSQYGAATARFGALHMLADGTCCAMVHIDDFPQETGVYYICTAGSPSIERFPDVGDWAGYPGPSEKVATTLFSITGESSFYIGCGSWNNADDTVYVCNRAGNAYYLFLPGKGRAHAVAPNGYVVTLYGILYGPNWTASEVDTGVEARHGIDSVPGSVMYTKNQPADLYVGGAHVATADDPGVFGTGATGVGNPIGCRAIFHGGSAKVLWVAGNTAEYQGGTPGSGYLDRCIIYSKDGGITWADKTGNFFDGGDRKWSGWTNSDISNAVVHIFEY